ncbi:hypothetical protein F4805DRAFT_453408 [Annulohypoxylon moriforme]|nr:hypothetical protein F4805DRAFT_453408 [Annulohypoxylon moriforme]
MPATALTDPWPVPTHHLRGRSEDDCVVGYEADLVIVIGKLAGSRSFSQSQVCCSKGFDGSWSPLDPSSCLRRSCPILAPSPSAACATGETMQKADMIFNCAMIVNFLSESNTLPLGMVIIAEMLTGMGI